jgi:hypothetical protein
MWIRIIEKISMYDYKEVYNLIAVLFVLYFMEQGLERRCLRRSHDWAQSFM